MTVGQELVRYLARAERFLDAGGCPYCSTLRDEMYRGKSCRCGWVVDPIRYLTDRKVGG